MYSGVRNSNGVKEESLRRYVPSIFAEEPHESRSSRYAFVPTWDVLQAMQREGFLIVQAQQQRVRDASRRDHTKHLIKLRHQSQVAIRPEVDSSVFELLLLNSHDGSSRYKLMAGIFRFICSNGLVIADSQMPSVSVHHTGKISDQVIDASYKITEDAPRVIDKVDQWKAVTLSRGEQEVYAAEACRLRFNIESTELSPVTPSALLLPRRHDDAGASLWSTYNRVQENCIKGGLRGRTRSSNGRSQVRHTRSVTGIDQDIRLNKSLWALAEGLAALKGVAPPQADACLRGAIPKAEVDDSYLTLVS